jgi:hypothetical protein
VFDRTGLGLVREVTEMPGVDDGGEDLYNVFVWSCGEWQYVPTIRQPNGYEAGELVQRLRREGKTAAMRLIGAGEPPIPKS